MKRLAGKVAVVTGGNSGIGLATAKLFRSEGAKVALSGRNQKTLDDAVRIIGSDVLAIRADVSQPDEIQRFFATVAEKWDKVDILFANAGIGTFAPVLDVTETDFDETFDINVRGLFFTVQKALPHLNDGSAIVLNASVVDELGMPSASVYSASKAAVRSGTPEEVANAVLFLASSESSYIAGVDLNVDGGMGQV